MATKSDLSAQLAQCEEVNSIVCVCVCTRMCVRACVCKCVCM